MTDAAAVIPDKNLRLALLDQVQDDYEWMSNRRDDYEAVRQRHPNWPRWEELEANELEPNPTLEEYLLTLAIPAAKLAAITSLTLDGDRSIYQWLGGEHWWDYRDLFTIRDLSGIEQCSAIEYLLLGQGIVWGASLRPLTALLRLRELHVCALTGLTHIDALLQLPALETLFVVNIATSDDKDEWQRVVGAIQSRHETGT